MAKKIIAITGSYRKGGIVERTVEAILKAAAEQGAETETVRLMERRIEFCTNCRKCTQPEGAKRGPCVHRDEMADLLDRIEAGVTYVNRPQGATTGAWPGYQPFGGWKASGTTGKAIGSFYYLPQYLREQSQTIVD